MKAISLIPPFIIGDGMLYNEITLFCEDSIEINEGDVIMLFPGAGEVLIHKAYVIEDYFEKYRVLKGKFLSVKSVVIEKPDSFIKITSVII